MTQTQTRQPRPKRGDWCVRMQEWHWPARQTWRLVRAVRVRKDGRITHVSIPSGYGGAKANGGTELGKAGAAVDKVYLISAIARDPRLSQLEDAKWRSGEEAISNPRLTRQNRPQGAFVPGPLPIAARAEVPPGRNFVRLMAIRAPPRRPVHGTEGSGYLCGERVGILLITLGFGSSRGGGTAEVGRPLESGHIFCRKVALPLSQLRQPASVPGPPATPREPLPFNGLRRRESLLNDLAGVSEPCQRCPSPVTGPDTPGAYNRRRLS